MNDFYTLVKARRSIRKYEDKEVSEEILDRILEAVRWSPTWTNSQCFELIVVKNEEIKKKLQEPVAKFRNPATKAIVDAPVLIVLCAKKGVSGFYNNEASTKFGDWFMFDLGIVAQTLCLSAKNEGLGSVVVGLFDHKEAEAILDVPEGYELVSIVPIGYPAKISKTPPRREVKEFVHKDKF